MVFRAVSANGAVKGYVQFCGVALLERVESVIQSDPRTGLSFPNYVFDLAVADTTREGGPDPAGNGTESDYRRAAELFRTLAR